MAGLILTGAAGSGKTAYAIDHILGTEANTFGKEIWVLLPNRLQNEAFRERLILAAGRNAILNIRFFEFYELYNLLLDLAGEPQRTIGWSASERILRQVIFDLDEQGQLPYYHLIAQTAGFVQLVSHFITELKQGLMDEMRFDTFAQTRTDKDKELARIFTAYQTFLKDNRLVDRDGAGWVALASLRNFPQLVDQVGLLVVDGYDNFNPLQAALLGQLAEAVDETLLTLTYEAERAQEVGRYFAYTLGRLQAHGAWKVQSLGVESISPLHHLERQLFRIHPQVQPAQNTLHLIEAPNARQEVKAVLREVKNLLLEGTDPEKILVVMRDLSTYAEAFRSTNYDLPLTIAQGESLLDNPAISIILNLIDLHQADFPRRTMLNLLHSPYLNAPDFELTDLDLLERFSLKKPVVGGREKWLNGLQQGYQAPEDSEDDLEIPPELIQKTALFFERLTPPEQATAREYVSWLENLIGRDPAMMGDEPDDMEIEAQLGFGLYQGVRETGDAQILIRDLYALHGFRGAIQDVLSAYDVLEAVQHIQQPVTWKVFRADLELSLRSRMANDPRNRSRAGRVLITSVLEARGLPHDYVFMVGLSEGIFPMSQTEDPLYSDRERLELETQGIDVLTAAERTRDVSLFYEICGLAQKRLILSRPTLDERGNPWQASPFWKNATAILSDAVLKTVKIGAAPTPEQAANRRELAVALSASLNQDTPPTQIWNYAAYLGTLWTQVLRGRTIELGRENARQPFDEFSGILQHPDLIAEVQEKLGEKRLWSASQLNELGTCGFRFFSRRLLALEAYEEPEEGYTVLQLGNVNHKILERTYQYFADHQIPIHIDHQKTALDVLEQIAEEVLATAPQDFGFQATHFWEQEKINLLDKLKALVALDFSPDSPLHKLADGERLTFRLEAPFGKKKMPALEISGLAGTLRVGGFIDRIDIVNHRYALVMDYKSGKTPSTGDIEAGRNFQMLVYLLAAEQLLKSSGYEVIGGLFWSIQQNKDGGKLETSSEIIPTAIDQLHYLVDLGRRGIFPNQPAKWEGGKCSTHCEFSQLCRLKRSNRYKTIEL